jgi:hypothetical protein
MERGIRLIGNGQAPVHMYCKFLTSRRTILSFVFFGYRLDDHPASPVLLEITKRSTLTPKSGEKLCGMIESGEIDPLKMVSHRVSIDELDTIYYKFDKKEDGMQKVFVETKFSAPPCTGSPSLTRYNK